jgi:hypothetical protein
VSVLVYATNSALEQSRRLLPAGAVLETLVTQAVAEGTVTGASDGGFVFIDDHGIVVRYAKVPRRYGGSRRAWLVTNVARKRGGSR